MKISHKLQAELNRLITELKELNSIQTQQEELELYDQAMSKIKQDNPEVFSLHNEIDQLALVLAK